ncbi:hypothetical protein LSH36_2117g00001 [Paralvinella palmiformis]|uniref:Methyltransferase FkbM domain-containing protein n=1 Tax=Paralvinella palmiformis TaxID=53620 RepID=A0AAD9IQW0_9ANNE|nr:hypothetical protein LSH36_2117g00001 [Paralvinella palmiformis]
MDSEARMTGTGGILNNVTMATGMKMRNPVVLICLKPLLYLEKLDKQYGIDATPNKLDTWIVPNVPDHLRNANEGDPELIRHIREFWIIPPFKDPISLQMHNNFFPVPGGDFSQSGQPTVVNKLLSNKMKGFYVECGTDYSSNETSSLYAECLPQPNKKSYHVELHQIWTAGALTDLIPDEQREVFSYGRKPLEIQCFPLYSILSALEIKKVDYFSLDIEGPEVEVLQNIPLNERIIDVLSVEKRIMNNPNGTAKKIDDIIRVLKPYGYHMERIVQMDIFVSRLPTN